MARGKPSRAQLDMVSGILTVLQSPEDCFDGALDVRNYGELTGIPSAKRLFAELLGVTPSQVLVGGSASLNLMYDLIAKAWTHGLLHSPRPWSQEPVVRFLCPAPGYDRHFRVSQSFGMELIPISMTPDGPDMDAVEAAVRDPAVKGHLVRAEILQPAGYRLFRRRRRPAGRPAPRRAGLCPDVGQRLLPARGLWPVRSLP